MPKPLSLLLCLLAFTHAFAQQPGLPFRPVRSLSSIPAAPANLTKFNLDFPGGTPADLVAAIEKATGKPLNVIIPTEDAGSQLPPLKMDNVNVADLFNALGNATTRTVIIPMGSDYSNQTVSCGFGADQSKSISDDTIWYFQDNRKITPLCRFYSLAPYLDRGFTVDDITTAIHSGWNMQVDSAPDAQATLFFHKETKLLIAVGDYTKLALVNQALSTLPATSVTSNDIDQMKATIESLKQQVNELNSEVRPRQPSDVESMRGAISSLKGQVDLLNSVVLHVPPVIKPQ